MDKAKLVNYSLTLF